MNKPNCCKNCEADTGYHFVCKDVSCECHKQNAVRDERSEESAEHEHFWSISTCLGCSKETSPQELLQAERTRIIKEVEDIFESVCSGYCSDHTPLLEAIVKAIKAVEEKE